MRGNIQRRGKSSWRIKVDIGRDASGKRLYDRTTVQGKRADAEAKLADMLAAIGKGAHVKTSKITVAEHVRERIDHWHKAGEISTRTFERYEQLLVNQIAPHLGDKMVQSLTTLGVEKWHVTLQTEGRKHGGGLAPTTVRSAHSVLSKALREGVKHGLLPRNVCGADGGETAPKGGTRAIKIIPAEEIESVVRKLRGRVIYCKAMISLFGGLRRGEVLALRWPHILLEKKLIHVCEAVEATKAHGLRIKPPKSKAGIRDVTLPDIVIEALTEHRRDTIEMRVALGLGRITDDTLVFPKTFSNEPQAPSQYSGDWREAVLMLDLPDVSLHALRHTHASQLIDAGIDIVRIAARLGHADASVTLRTYAHLFRKRDDLSAAAINAALGTLGRP